MSDCKCKRNALGDLVKRRHDTGCPDAGKRSGKSGKASPEAEARRDAKAVKISLEGGKDALAAAATKAGYRSGSALVAAVVKRIGSGQKLFLDP